MLSNQITRLFLDTAVHWKVKDTDKLLPERGMVKYPERQL